MRLVGKFLAACAVLALSGMFFHATTVGCGAKQTIVNAHASPFCSTEHIASASLVENTTLSAVIPETKSWLPILAIVFLVIVYPRLRRLAKDVPLRRNVSAENLPPPWSRTFFAPHLSAHGW